MLKGKQAEPSTRPRGAGSQGQFPSGSTRCLENLLLPPYESALLDPLHGPGSLCCASLHSCLKPRQHLGAATPCIQPHAPSGNLVQTQQLRACAPIPTPTRGTGSSSRPAMHVHISQQANRETSSDRAAQRPSRKHSPHVAAGQGQHIHRHPVTMHSA